MGGNTRVNMGGHECEIRKDSPGRLPLNECPIGNLVCGIASCENSCFT